MSSPTANDRIRLIKRLGGGLIRSALPPRTMRGALRDGPDISWLSRVMAGDDQGNVGACAMFAMASWAEIVHGAKISNEARLAAYQQACAELGRGDLGLTFQEAFEAACKAGWLPGSSRIEAVSDLESLGDQPILAGYEVTPAWETPNAAGCLDHTASTEQLGGHATVIVAKGTLTSQADAGKLVWVENSWGLSWGWRGICVMTEALHASMCFEMWTIR